MADDLVALAHRLSQEGEPFALATVVRCERPTSAKPGAKALIQKDGTAVGWIGGSCAEPVVIKEALRALRDGQPRFIALVGDRGTAPDGREGVQAYTMTCHSGGTLEIFVEPVLPKPELLLIGGGPVVETLAKLGRAMEFAVTRVPTEHDRLPLRVTPRTFIVVATHGAFDEGALELALRSEARYVSLVASRKRAAVVGDALRARGVSDESLRRLKAPAGLDIGAVTPDEIAASILAEIVQVARSQDRESRPAGAAAQKADAAEAKDPVCGMTVEIASAKYYSGASGRSFYFCSAHCKQAFDRDPARFIGSAAR